jgi:prepilin-type N-terminal cleavage/methylation domain-containing protein
VDANQLRTPEVGGRRSGLTLVELLVVLVILAVMTVIAVQSTEFLVDQSRYSATQQTLQNIQSAIMGPPNGNPAVSGFVADMGRLPMPVYVGTTISGDPLRELWDPTAVAANLGTGYNLTPVTVPSATSVQTGAAVLKTAPATNLVVTIPSGWHGPYLQLPIGSVSPLDGWGNPFHSIYQPQGVIAYPPAVPALGFPINVVCSLGSDNALDLTIPANPYSQDQYVPPQLTVPPALLPLVNFSQLGYGTVAVTVQSINTTVTPTALTNPYPTTEATPKVRVVLFAPVNGLMTTFILDSTGAVNAYNPNATPATYLPASPYYAYAPNPTPVDFALTAAVAGTTAPTTSVAGSFNNVPIGSRAIQAFQYDAATMVITKKSPLTYLNVTAASIPTTLILQ